MKFKRTLSLFMLGVMLSSSVPLNVFADDTIANNDISAEDITASGSSISVTNNDIDVDFKVTGQWDGGFNGEITITNTGSTLIENWQIEMTFPQEITNIWNAQIESHENDNYLIRNAGGNNNIDIPVGGSVSFGFSGTYTDEITVPSDISLVTGSKNAEDNEYTVEYQLLSDWGSGFTSQLMVTNNTDKPMEAWHLEFDFNGDITSMWGGIVDKNENGRYYISNAGYNSVIPANGTVIIGFGGVPNESNDNPANYLLTYFGDGAAEDNTQKDVEPVNAEDIVLYTIGFYDPDTNIINVAWSANYDYGTYDIYVSDDNETYIYDGTADEAWHYGYDIGEGFELKYFKVVLTTSDGQVVEAVPFKVIGEDGSYYVNVLDSDEDYIPDILELAVGSDPNSKDTDNDGLTDYFELCFTFSDPCVYDSITKGISDADADSDNDGLANKEEIVIATDPISPDTDGDGLNDNDEVRVYKTSPFFKDTDFDGLEDSDEIILGFDPLNEDTNGNGIKDGDEKFEQTISKSVACEELPGITGVSVTLTTNGNIEKVVSVEDMYGIDILSSDVVGLAGAPIEFTCENEFDSAEVSFEYDEEKLGFDVDNLGILWYNEEEQFYEVMDATLDKENHCISMITPHFSEYMAVDLEKWDNAWKEDFNAKYQNASDYEKNKYWNGDIVSASDMLNIYNDYFGINGIELNEILPICEEGDVYCRLGTVQLNLTTGETLDYKCLFLSYEEFYGLMYGVYEDDTVVVAPLDGWVASYISYPFDDYPFSISRDELWPNKDLVASYSYDLDEDRFYLIPADTLDTSDRDGDGIYDVYESVGLRLASGRVIYTSTETDIDPATGWCIGYDTDEDGASDGMEIERYNGEKGYFRVVSNPLEQDTDKDGLFDYARIQDSYDSMKKGRTIAPRDAEPTKFNGSKDFGGIWNYHINHRLNNEAPHKLADWYKFPDGNETVDPVTDLAEKNMQSQLVTALFAMYMFRWDDKTMAMHSQTNTDIREAEGTGVGEMDWEHIAISLQYQLCFNMIGVGEGRFFFDEKFYLKQTAQDILDSLKNDQVLDAEELNYLESAVNKLPDFSDTQIDMCQRVIGYCSMYDWIFCHGVGGNMDADYLDFYDIDTENISSNNEAEHIYRIWMWRGYYRALASGAEVGIYNNPHQNDVLDLFNDLYHNADKYELKEDLIKVDKLLREVDSKIPYMNDGRQYSMIPLFNVISPTDIYSLEKQANMYYDEDEYNTSMWDIANFELPMQMYLYKKTKTGFKTILQWEPKNPQWWIASFNPNDYNTNAKDMFLIASIDFSKYYPTYADSTETFDIDTMYKALKDKNFDNNTTGEYLIFDDLERKVWICWYE